MKRLDVKAKRRKRGRERARGRQREREWEMRAHSRSGAWKRAIGEVTGWWRGCAVVLVLAERREREGRREWARRSPEGWRETSDERRRDPGEYDRERK